MADVAKDLSTGMKASSLMKAGALWQVIPRFFRIETKRRNAV
jgi:hypothetical protein